MLHRLELSGDADSENNHGGSSRTYILHRTGRTQEDDQLLREGREWADPTGRQGWIDPMRAGLLDEDSAPAVDRGDGSDDLQWLDLRSSASACHPIKVAHPLMLRAIAAAKKKNDQIDARKIADCMGLRFPARVPHDASGVPGSPPHPAVPAADGAVEEPCLWDC